MTDLIRRVATLEADSKTYKEDFKWMKRAIDSIKGDMIRVKTTLWCAFIVGQLAAAGFASWLAR